MLEIKKNIYWIGIRDWELRRFHGHELSTHRGSTYNSYVIKDQKTVLVDTVWEPYKEEFVEKLEQEIGLANIDYIVIQHCEIDHSGSLELLMEKIPNTPIVCTKNGAENIKKHFHKDYNFQIVKTGDQLNIGEYELAFVEMQMIHWPDSMLTYIKGANTVLSNDAFGQHYVTSAMFNDQVDQCELYQEAIKYYANIVNPYSAFVKKKIAEIVAMNLPIDMIAPSHGIIWRKDPMQIVEKYQQWASDYQENYVVIVYDTMYNATRQMADAILAGLESKGVAAKIFNASTSDHSDLMVELFRASAIIMGSCTVNNVSLSSIAGVLEEMRGLRFKNKCGAAFGSYGWSGEAHKLISKKMEELGIKIIEQPLGIRYRPTSQEIEQCVAFGQKLAECILE